MDAVDPSVLLRFRHVLQSGDPGAITTLLNGLDAAELLLQRLISQPPAAKSLKPKRKSGGRKW